MLRNRLSVLLAERELTAAKVYEDTGISRSTLSSLVNNSGDGVQYKTLDKLCNYLGVSPNDFFEYAPFEFNYAIEKEGSNEIFAIEVNTKNIVRTYFFDTHIGTDNKYAETRTRLKEFDLYFSIGTEFDFYEEVYDFLTIGFKNIINQKILEHAYTFIEKEIENENYCFENKDKITILISIYFSNHDILEETKTYSLKKRKFI